MALYFFVFIAEQFQDISILTWLRDLDNEQFITPHSRSLGDFFCFISPRLEGKYELHYSETDFADISNLKSLELQFLELTYTGKLRN